MISQRAKEANAHHHVQEPMWGASALRWHDDFVGFAQQLGAKSILDFGCGKGRIKQQLGDKFDVTEYDPGIPGKDQWPAPADMVVCLDVMEHVEGPCVDATLVEIGELARKGAFLLIALYSNGAKLPNSDQAIHCTVLTPDQWLDRFAVAWQFPCHVLTQLVKKRVVKKRGSASNNQNVLKVWMEKL